jgi:amidohydrolase
MIEVEELVSTRRDLHANPELAFDESRTASVVARRLLDLGLEVREAVGRTGVVADLGRPGSGPHVVLRAEMDGLPVDEVDGSPFRSTRPGVMHACGHDAHMAVLLAVATELARREGPMRGLVRFLFQPAEEIGAGAEAMLEDGALDGAAWDAMLAIHLRPFLTVGRIGICRGSATARVGEFAIEVRGTGGHGGRPHVSTDALLAAVEIVSALQTLISREVSALDSAVLSVCSFHAGTAANVMPEVARVEGTVRSASDDVYERLFRRIEEVATTVATAFRCTASVERREMMPQVRNDPQVADVVRRAAETIVGTERVVEIEPVMAGDDVAYFFDRVPGCYIFVGAAHDDGRPPSPNHSPSWDFDERALEIGANVVLGATELVLGGTTTKARTSG